MQSTRTTAHAVITRLSVISIVALAGALVLGGVPQQAAADPYAGYSHHRHHVPTVDREARTVSRGAVVVERDRNRRVVERAAVQRVNPGSQVRIVTNPQTPQARAAANVYGQALLDQARRQSPNGQQPDAQHAEQTEQAEQHQGEQHREPEQLHAEPQAQSQSAAHHTNPHYADNPHLGLGVQHHHVVQPRHHVTHHYHHTTPKRAHVYHWHTPHYKPVHVVSPHRKHFHHRPHRPARLHTGVHIGYHGKHVGVHYRHGLSTHRFRHHHHRHRSICRTTGVRLHFRF